MTTEEQRPAAHPQAEEPVSCGTTILDLQKNSRERVRVSVDQYKGHEYVNIRTWYVDASGEYRPSKNGVTLKPSLIPQLVQGLQLAARAADPKGAS